MKICVYTCITGDYDSIEEIREPEKGIDYYCFTNNPSLSSKTWKIIQIKDNSLDNCRLARRTKILGHKILDKYDVAVWTDANIIWQKPISEFVKQFHKSDTLSISAHHARTNVKDEADACLIENKETADTLKDTIEFLEREGFPDNVGLFESPVFIREPHDKIMNQTCKTWFDIIQNKSKRDQLSLPYAIWKNKMPVNVIPIIAWKNPWYTYTIHTSNDIFSCHRIYFGDLSKPIQYDLFQSEDNPKNSDSFTIKKKVPADTNIIDFMPSALIGVVISDISIDFSYSSKEELGFYSNGSDLITCTRRSIIRFKGSFKKGGVFSITLRLTPPDMNGLSILAERLQAQSDILKNNLSTLSVENKALRANLDRIQSSTLWRLLSFVKKVILYIPKRLKR